MKSILLLLAFLFFLFPLFAQITFQKFYGGNNSDDGAVVRQTSDGGYMLAGTITSSVGNSDFSVVKTNATGDIQWSESYGTGWMEQLSDATPTSDGGYIACGIRYDTLFNWLTYVVKINSDGTLNWSRCYNSSTSLDYPSIKETNGGYILYCTRDSVPPTSGPIPSAMKISYTGLIIWNKIFGLVYDIVPVASGYAALCRHADSTGQDLALVMLDSNGTVQWSKAYDGPDFTIPRRIIACANGDLILSGSKEQATFSHIFIIRVTAAGNILWSRSYSSALSVLININDIREDTAGNFLVAATFWALNNGIGMMLSSNGQVIFANRYGGNTYTQIISADVANDAGCVFAGSIHSSATPSDTMSMYFVKTDNTGNSGCGDLAVPVIANMEFCTAYSILKNSLDVGTMHAVSTNTGLSVTAGDVCVVGINDAAENGGVSVFPNPFSGNFTINLSQSEKGSQKELFLYDVYGNVVRRVTFCSDMLIVQGADLASGLYFYLVEADGKMTGFGKVIAQ